MEDSRQYGKKVSKWLLIIGWILLPLTGLISAVIGRIIAENNQYDEGSRRHGTIMRYTAYVVIAAELLIAGYIRNR